MAYVNQLEYKHWREKRTERGEGDVIKISIISNIHLHIDFIINLISFLLHKEIQHF